MRFITATLSLAATLASLVSVSAVPFNPYLIKNTALIIIDMQNDFINGSLGNTRAPSVLPKFYNLLDNHSWPFIVASQDWHPPDHVSFASSHGANTPNNSYFNITFLDDSSKWEDQWAGAAHCVPETWGAQIETGIQSRLHLLEGFRTTVNYIKKAQNHSVDSYSAFGDNQYHQFTTLHDELQLHKIEKIVIGGLVTGACVRGSAIDAVKFGYDVTLLYDVTEASTQASKDASVDELAIKWGVKNMTMEEWEQSYPPHSIDLRVD